MCIYKHKTYRCIKHERAFTTNETQSSLPIFLTSFFKAPWRIHSLLALSVRPESCCLENDRCRKKVQRLAIWKLHLRYQNKMVHRDVILHVTPPMETAPCLWLHARPNPRLSRLYPKSAYNTKIWKACWNKLTIFYLRHTHTTCLCVEQIQALHHILAIHILQTRAKFDLKNGGYSGVNDFELLGRDRGGRLSWPCRTKAKHTLIPVLKWTVTFLFSIARSDIALLARSWSLRTSKWTCMQEGGIEGSWAE